MGTARRPTPNGQNSKLPILTKKRTIEAHSAGALTFTLTSIRK